MSLRLATAAVVALLFMIAGLVVGQTLPDPPPERAVGDPPKPATVQQRERTGSDANIATGTFGTTGPRHCVRRCR